MVLDDKDKWLKDFTDYSNVDAEAIQISQSELNKLKKRLFPNPWVVFGKVTALHLAVGFLSLAICNQFGLNPFGTDQSLTNWFVKIAGHHVCMLLCGVFFVSTTYVLANFVLTLEELESVKRYEWLQTGVVGLVSLATFYFFGAELVVTFAALWMVGALVGGFLSIEGSYLLRRELA